MRIRTNTAKTHGRANQSELNDESSLTGDNVVEENCRESTVVPVTEGNSP